ncbi:MAG: sigma-54-dependent Fis family transcriptional regulator [Deltaproteobacteria bacterium]|nr:sigma-54-dependent Fis family transcriptional regulator [Deltaproteobacteria bacterium]
MDDTTVRPFHEQDRSAVATDPPPEREAVSRDDRPYVALGLTGTSHAIRCLRQQVWRAARMTFPVHIRGETGTGKERVARALHDHGVSTAGPFVAVNCAAFDRSLIVGELFGHERGAFTGAMQTRRGLFERAHGGTLFLDEVGELSLEAQAMLLRVLETGEVRRLGGEEVRRVQVRLVTATHRSLAKMVSSGRFRSDLFWRVFVFVLHVPALRERHDDLREIAIEVLDELSVEAGRRSVRDEALERLQAHAWPGNVRELRTVLRRAVAGTDRATLTAEDITRAIAADAPVAAEPGRSYRHPPTDSCVRDALVASDGKLATAARLLGVPRTTLRERLRRMGAA